MRIDFYDLSAGRTVAAYAIILALAAVATGILWLGMRLF